jgi:hypothetical protein
VRTSLGLLAIGVVLSVLGVIERDDPELPLPLRQRLNGELQKLRSKGHAAELLVTSGHAEELSEKARARAEQTGETVIAISADWVAFVPSAKDREVATPRAWSDMAQRIAWQYLRNDDVGGAATAVVRGYSVNLISRGLYPAQPPLPPIFLPDITRTQTRPIDVHLTGFGIVFVILALATFIARKAEKRRALRTRLETRTGDVLGAGS